MDHPDTIGASEARHRLEEIIGSAREQLAEIKRIESMQAHTQKAILSVAENLKGVGKDVDSDQFTRFIGKPYTIIPHGRNKVLVAVPKFIKGFQIGWLWKDTDTYYIYQFDQYSAWLGDAPQDLLAAIEFEKKFDVIIDGNTISFAPGQKQEVKDKLKHHLQKIGDTSATIMRGHEFDVLAASIESGCLPFRAQPVADADRQPIPASLKFNIRGYQAPAVKKFLETGAVGVFYPTGAGKSFITMYIASMLRGKKLLVVPTVTLIEQWHAYFEQWAPHLRQDVRVVTYQGYRPSDSDKFMLTIYDECQRLPADTFSRLATINTKYRLGLSASPHREDGRESYIFALTGFPVGLNWQEYMQTVGKSYHPIYVHVVKSKVGKLAKMRTLVNPKKKTLIFCDTIEIGKQASAMLSVPYVYGESANRINTITDNMVTVVSRVADLGVSIKDLQQIIEIDFMFGSRQQELQRSGRLLHSEKAERHDIIMTEAEVQAYGKRLWALQEKGFTIKIVS